MKLAGHVLTNTQNIKIWFSDWMIMKDRDPV